MPPVQVNRPSSRREQLLQLLGQLEGAARIARELDAPALATDLELAISRHNSNPRPGAPVDRARSLESELKPGQGGASQIQGRALTAVAPAEPTRLEEWRGHGAAPACPKCLDGGLVCGECAERACNHLAGLEFCVACETGRRLASSLNKVEAKTEPDERTPLDKLPWVAERIAWTTAIPQLAAGDCCRDDARSTPADWCGALGHHAKCTRLDTLSRLTCELVDADILGMGRPCIREDEASAVVCPRCAAREVLKRYAAIPDAERIRRVYAEFEAMRVTVEVGR